mmetsp:Transcript_36882/g.108747  ORF Transcript_36882/g.108747 Transcript_36882/m.108747 type:complete len:236 (-) Transcript_36882:279-986(-)
MPMLFHSCGLLGVNAAATRYLMSATSMSWLSWWIDPTARMVRGLRGSCAREFPRCVNACSLLLVRRKSRPSVVSTSVFSGLCSSARMYTSSADGVSSRSVNSFPSWMNVESCGWMSLAARKLSMAPSYCFRYIKHMPLLCIISQSGAPILAASSYASIAARCLPKRYSDRATCFRLATLCGLMAVACWNSCSDSWMSPRCRWMRALVKRAYSHRLSVSRSTLSISFRQSSNSCRT